MILVLGGLLSACQGDEVQARATFEEAFPTSYCAWLESCDNSDGEGYGLDGDCVGYYTRVMEAEREHHECFDPSDAERCIRDLNPAEEAYVPCEGPQRVRMRPATCWEVTWMAPCNTADEEG